MDTPLETAIRGVKQAAKKPKPATGGHGMKGTVCEICDHPTKPGMARVTIDHGTPKAKKGADGPGYYSENKTRLTVPMAKAQAMRLGQKVRVAVHPEGSPREEAGESAATERSEGGS